MTCWLMMALLAGPISLASGLADPPAAPAQAEETAPMPGDEAPPISVDDVRARTMPAWASDLRADLFAGKVLVLDFTTSWCSGCVLSVPHINELAESFAPDDAVVFLAVTNENAKDADAFIAAHDLKIPLASDPDASMFESWWVNAVPMTAIIDAQGRIACVTHPMAISREIIELVKAGEPVPPIALLASNEDDTPRDPYANRQRRSWNVANLLDESGPAAIGATLTRVDKPQGMARTNPKTGEMRLLGMQATSLIAAIHRANVRDLIIEAELPSDAFYDLIVNPPEPSQTVARDLARRAIERELGVRIESRMVKSKVRVLRRAPDAPELVPVGADVQSGGTARPGLIKFSRTTVADFAAALSRFSATPIIDGTGLTGEYAFDLSWDPSGGSEAARAAIAAAGFTFEDGEAELERIAVVVPR